MSALEQYVLHRSHHLKMEDKCFRPIKHKDCRNVLNERIASPFCTNMAVCDTSGSTGRRLHFQLVKSKEKTPSDSRAHSTGTTEVWASCIGCVINIAVTCLLVSLWSLSCLLTAVDRIVDNGTDVLNLPFSLWFTHCSSFLKDLLSGVGWLI